VAFAIIDHTEVSFADGNGGHAVTFPSGAPAANDLDVICVNSDTTVSTPSGFSVATTFVNNQGSYIFYRFALGSEGASVTITTAGNFNTTAEWSRWSGGAAFDVGTNAHVDGNGNTATPALNTGALAATGELGIAFGALTDSVSALATTPVWSTGYTAIGTASIGTGGSANAVASFSAYNTPVGTAAETPSVTWTNQYRNRYILFASFTAGTSTSASAGNASGTGAANDASVVVAPSAGATSGTGAALDASAAVLPNADVATATGTALDASVSVFPGAEVTSGTGTAYDALAGVYGLAEGTAGSGAALDATVAVFASAGCASGTGSGLNPSFPATVVRGRLPIFTETSSEARTIRTSTRGAP
jgi:hypothetical protein